MMMGGNGPEQMMGMMSKMMGGDSGAEGSSGMNPEQMMQMLSAGPLGMITAIPKEKRIEFMPKLIGMVFQKATSDMSDEEKQAVIDAVCATIQQ